MTPMKTSEGSPRAALLNQAAMKGQTAAHMHPLSAIRPPLHAGPVNGLMTQLPRSKKSVQQAGAKAQLLGLVMQMMKARANQGR